MPLACVLHAACGCGLQADRCGCWAGLAHCAVVHSLPRGARAPECLLWQLPGPAEPTPDRLALSVFFVGVALDLVAASQPAALLVVALPASVGVLHSNPSATMHRNTALTDSSPRPLPLCGRSATYSTSSPFGGVQHALKSFFSMAGCAAARGTAWPCPFAAATAVTVNQAVQADQQCQGPWPWDL